MSLKVDEDCSSVLQVQHKRLMLEASKDDFENPLQTEVFKGKNL